MKNKADEATHEDENQNVVLAKLHQYQCGVVSIIDAESEDILHLQTMGVCLGRTIKLIKAGDPMILRVLGSRLGISARLAEQVWVTPCPDVFCKHD